MTIYTIEGGRTLWISDIHFSNNLPHSKPSAMADAAAAGISDRLLVLQSACEQVVHFAKACLDGPPEGRVSAIFIPGDIFDQPRPDPVALRVGMSCLVGFAAIAPTFVLAGNHDAATRDAKHFVLDVIREVGDADLHLVGFGDTVHLVHNGAESADSTAIWPFEYAPTAIAADRMASALPAVGSFSGEHGPRIKNVAMIHQSVIGCGHDGWKAEEGLSPIQATNGFDFTFSGHFHNIQRFPDGAPGSYVGAPIQHHFGDSGEERGFWDIDFEMEWDDDGPAASLIKTVAPRFVILDGADACDVDAVGVDDAAPLVCERIGEEAASGDYVRLEFAVTAAEWTALQPLIKAVKSASTCRVSATNSVVARSEARTDIKADGDMKDALQKYPPLKESALDREALLAFGIECLEEANRG